MAPFRFLNKSLLLLWVLGQNSHHIVWNRCLKFESGREALQVVQLCCPVLAGLRALLLLQLLLLGIGKLPELLKDSSGYPFGLILSSLVTGRIFGIALASFIADILGGGFTGTFGGGLPKAY